MSTSAPSSGAPQGEAIAVWLLWCVLLAMIGVTYSRLEPAQLYNVSGDGVSGGLSRMLVSTNFPVALVAIALMLVALDVLPSRAWWLAAPAIVLCALTVVTVDPDDLDARFINLLPATGVAIAAMLSMSAAMSADHRVAPRQRRDIGRVVVGVLAVLVATPWIAAELGVFLPEGLFITERIVTGSDGVVGPAVHLGHHHGLDAALLIVTAMLLSRVRLRPGRRATAARWYVSLLFAYGLWNLIEDYWNEQVFARGWSHRVMQSGQLPGFTVAWLVIVVITVVGQWMPSWSRASKNLRA